MAKRQMIDLGGDRFYVPRRNMVPSRFVRHFLEGYHGREFSGKRKYVFVSDPLGGMGGDRQQEVETDALFYHRRGQNLRQEVDAGSKVLTTGEWLRSNYTVTPKAENEYRISY